MNNIIVLAIMFLTFIAILLFMEREAKRRDKVEKERFREFVLAIKTKDAIEYIETMPTEGDLPVQEEDELIDLDQVDPETLLQAMKQR